MTVIRVNRQTVVSSNAADTPTLIKNKALLAISIVNSGRGNLSNLSIAAKCPHTETVVIKNLRDITVKGLILGVSLPIDRQAKDSQLLAETTSASSNSISAKLATSSAYGAAFNYVSGAAKIDVKPTSDQLIKQGFVLNTGQISSTRVPLGELVLNQSKIITF